MPKRQMQQLSREINSQARRHYKQVVIALPEDVPPRQRYAFVEADNFYPEGLKGLGRVIRASRQEGLNAIHGPVAGGRPNEHSWVYVPAQGLWVDATVSSELQSVNVDKCLEAFLSHAFGDIEMVHSHTTPGARQAYEDGKMSASYLMEAALPSGRDLKNLSDMHGACPQDASLTSSIVSHHGVTRVDLGKPVKGDRYHDFAISGEYEQHVSGSSLEPALAIREALADLAARSHLVLSDSQYLALGRVPSHAFITSFSPLPG